MAESMVVKEYLTPEMIESGARLIAKLDEMGLPIVAAFWSWDYESNDWRLRIATPDRDAIGPQDPYRKIGEAREVLGEAVAAIPMFGVRLAGVNDKTVRALRKNVPTDPKVLSRIRLKKSALDGHYIDDVLVYRAA
jgi:hypothetical protein